jgi:hypothetical protein
VSFPARWNFSLTCRPQFNWKSEDLGLEMTFRLDAQCGKVDIECGLNKFERSRHFMPLLLRAQDIATASGS